MVIAKLNLSVGGAFYIRPIIADGRLRTGLLTVVQTYCPEKVPTAEEFLDSQNISSYITNCGSRLMSTLRGSCERRSGI